MCAAWLSFGSRQRLLESATLGRWQAMMLGICGLPAESMQAPCTPLGNLASDVFSDALHSCQECLEGRRVDPSPPSMEAARDSIGIQIGWVASVEWGRRT